MGKTDSVAFVNYPASEVSETIYNRYLLPYWNHTLEPVKYEQIPIRDLRTGNVLGVQDEPVYDYPLSKVSDLYIPASIVSWGLIGLVIQLAYGGFTRLPSRAKVSTRR